MSEVMTTDPVAMTYDLLPPGYPATGLTYIMPPSDAGTQSLVAANDATGQTTFSLLTMNWTQLQSYVAGSIIMPTSTSDFESRYGKFDGEDDVVGCATALADVQGLSTQFGDPKALRAAIIADPNVLASDTPPEQIYTHIVWLADKIEGTSATIASSYDTVYKLLQGETSQQQVDDLTQFLFDPTVGPIPLSANMATLTADLITILGKFEKEVNDDNAKVQVYVSNESSLMQEAKDDVAALQHDIDALTKQAKKAHDEWVKYCIVAGCMAPVALVGPLIVPVVAIETAVGVEASKYLAQYKAYCARIAQEKAELKQKQRFLGDMAGFNDMVDLAGPALQSFLTSLQMVEGSWVTMNNQLVAISKSLTVDTVSESVFVSKVQTQAAVDAWNNVAQLATEYTSTSLIDYSPTVFGEPLPDA